MFPGTVTQYSNSIVQIIKDMVSEVSENPLSFTASEHLFTLLDKFQVIMSKISGFSEHFFLHPCVILSRSKTNAIELCNFKHPSFPLTCQQDLAYSNPLKLNFFRHSQIYAIIAAVKFQQ